VDVVRSPDYSTVSKLKEQLERVVGTLEDTPGIDSVVKAQMQAMAEIIADVIDLFGYAVYS